MTEADKVTIIKENIPDSLAKALMERQQMLFCTLLIVERQWVFHSFYGFMVWAVSV